MKKLLLASLLFGSTSALAASFVVKDIRVEGAQPNAVIAQLPVRVGKTVTDNDLTNIVRSLYLKGSYDDVRASRDSDTLVIQVVEKPVIASVVISGNKSIPDDALKQNLSDNGFKAGAVLNRAKLEEFRKGLEDYYHSVGRYNAKVETLINKLPNGTSELTLKIEENDVALLKSIEFEGNKEFSSGKLQEQMELQPDSWWKFFGNKFDQQQFSKDLDTLRQFYLNQGYAKFQVVGTDVKLAEDRKATEVKIVVNEGDRYNISSARIVGNVAGMGSELAPTLENIHIGEIFRSSDIHTVEEQIKSILGSKGYASAQVNVHPEFNEAEKTIALSFVVDAGNRYSVRQIRFEGNDISADKTLRQEMRQQEGAWLSSQLVELGKLRLDRTGFFETVESRTEMVQGTNDELDIIYKVKERNTGSINFGIGYGTESGLSYQASIKQDNFLGMGSSISLGGTRNDYGTSVSLGYNEPYFTKDGVSLGGNVFFEKYDNSKSSTSSSYSRTTYGVNSALSFPVNENNSYYIGLGYTYNKLSNIYPEYNRALYLASMKFDNWSFKAHDFDLSFGWNYNSLNRGFFPTSGVQANLGGKITTPGSSNKYYKLNLDVTGFYPLDREHSWVLSGKTSLSYANGFGGKRIPFYQNFSAGGIGSLRGFAYGAVGPNAIYLMQNAPQICTNGVNTDERCYTNLSTDITGGNAMATASVELIVPTPFVADKNQRSVRTSVFVDAATVWNTRWKEQDKPLSPIDYSKPGRIRSSAGVALQWQSPIGPLVFSYAKPIKKYEGDEIEQFQFSVGGSF